MRGFVYCANCKGEQVRDIQSGSVSGELELATLGRRFGAMWLDSVLFTFIFMIIGVAIGLAAVGAGAQPDTTGEALNLVGIVLGFATAFVYEGLMLQLRGQTLGKMAVGIKVVGPDGSAISPGQAWSRSLVRNLFNYLVFIDYLPAAFTKQKTCIHDMVAKTRVVRVRK